MENNTIVSYPYPVEMYFRVTGDFDMRSWDRLDRDRMVVGFTTTYAISAYHL
jgi:hypothetical protein